MAEPLLTEEETTDLRWVMSDQRGRRFVRHLMVKTGLHKSATRMRANVSADERVLFNVAQQDFGRRIQAYLIEADPLAFQLMNGEAQARKLMDKGKAEESEVEDDE